MRGNPVPDTYTIKVGEDSIEIDATELEKDCVRKGLRALGYTLNESRPTEREVDNFLHNALDWASIDDGESSESKKSEEASDGPNVADAKECKEALDKLIVGSDKLKGYGRETVLTEDVSVGAEMPVARVELGIRADKSAEPYYKAGDLLEYYTFDFSGGMCHITFHLQGEDWNEMLSDHPSVTSMIEDPAPNMIDELENHDFVNRPGDKN